MLIYEALNQDHLLLVEVLKRLAPTSEGAPEIRRSLLTQLRQQLTSHTRAAEKAFYSSLKEINETEDVVIEAYEEHHTAELLLRELEAIDAHDERWQAKFTLLKQSIEHHISHEEGEIFEIAQAVIAPDEARKMARVFQDFKEDSTDGPSFMPRRLVPRRLPLSRETEQSFAHLKSTP